MKKTVIKLCDTYYGSYNIDTGPILETDIENAHIFKSKHEAEYFFKHILRDYFGYERAKFILLEDLL